MRALRPARRSPLPNPANLAAQLRARRASLLLIVQQYDEAIERIEKNDGEPQQRNA